MNESEIIDFEAHFYTKDYVKALLGNKSYPKYVRDDSRDIYWLWYTSEVQEPHVGQLLSKLVNVDKERLNDMDKAGVKIQVLSLSAPGCEQFDPVVGTELAKKVNDELSSIVEKSPDRFIGLAALAPQDPERAADELERAVRDLGLKGWKTHSNICGEYLDDEKFSPILERAERLRIPIFLHPTVPQIKEIRKTYGYALAGPAFGFTFDTALCMMRLILSGAFDKYPNLKIVMGHLGESLPYLINRLDFLFVTRWVRESMEIKISKKPSEYLKNNVFIGTSGDFPLSSILCAIDIMGSDRVLFASDYPYEDSQETIKRIAALPLPEKEKEKIYCLNAKLLLNIK